MFENYPPVLTVEPTPALSGSLAMITLNGTDMESDINQFHILFAQGSTTVCLFWLTRDPWPLNTFTVTSGYPNTCPAPRVTPTTATNWSDVSFTFTMDLSGMEPGDYDIWAAVSEYSGALETRNIGTWKVPQPQ